MVEKQLAKLAGVMRAEVNYVAGSAIVVYNETALDLKVINARVHECGYDCAGERVPQLVFAAEDPPDEAAAVPGSMQAMVGDLRNRFWVSRSSVFRSSSLR